MADVVSGKKSWNLNWVALAILLIAYIFSAGRFFLHSLTHRDGDNSKVVRVAHWQLEPGYREALDWAMQEYNNLPHVKKAGIKVEQLPLPSRVYGQFLNVHLISGTAPDIAAAGRSNLIKGNSLGRFYTALGSYVTEPNPYNALEFTSPDLEPELREYLATAAWKDTLIDGMEGGWSPFLNDYYKVPISNLGGNRFYYNMTYLREGKTLIEDALEQSPQPEWLNQLWLEGEHGKQQGYLPDNQRLRDWLVNKDEPPQTLGQLILFCTAIQEYARQNNLEYLTPISVGNYSAGDPIYNYEAAIFRLFGPVLDQDGVPGVSGLEAIDGLARGAWSLDSEPMREYVDLARLLVTFYPAGYQGLDREQIQRRFVSGEAAVFASGSWDAAGVFKGAQSSEDPEKRFNVAIAPAPMPASDERWGNYMNYVQSEANFQTGVPLSINKQSPNFDWALDFLQFASSQPVNEEINRRASWLPVTIGAQAVDSMVEFKPIIEGYPDLESFYPVNMRSAIRSKWIADFRLVITGELSYDDFISGMMDLIERPHQGLQGYWNSELYKIRDQSRALDRNLSVDDFASISADDPRLESRKRSMFYQSVLTDEGASLEILWRRLHGDAPLPRID